MASECVTNLELLISFSDFGLPLAAYFKQRTVDELTPIEDIPNVGRIPVPEGLFKSARATKSKRDDPKRNILGTPSGSDSFTVTSGSGVLCTIFPSSGNGPQTAHTYTQDGFSRSHSPLPIVADPSAPARSVFPSRSPPTHHNQSSRPSPRPVPAPAAHARLTGNRQTPSLVPLEFLQSCSSRRDPTDERMLQQLSASHSPSADPSRSPNGPGGNAGRMTPYKGF
jgi:Gti1/Pac2 family transcription factor